ncbi:hypothetical protein F5X98DRAFT_216351 [Xylaria grammica]|nr:hypothetical protein F5X98DRAFT_216351 [Xylaria grammica]
MSTHALGIVLLPSLCALGWLAGDCSITLGYARNVGVGLFKRRLLPDRRDLRCDAQSWRGYVGDFFAASTPPQPYRVHDASMQPLSQPGFAQSLVQAAAPFWYVITAKSRILRAYSSHRARDVSCWVTPGLVSVVARGAGDGVWLGGENSWVKGTVRGPVCRHLRQSLAYCRIRTDWNLRRKPWNPFPQLFPGLVRNQALFESPALHMRYVTHTNGVHSVKFLITLIFAILLTHIHSPPL